MKLRVLGAAAGGGLPQWNCGCENCWLARRRMIEPRTQDSVAVSEDGSSWFLLNASPDVTRQLEASPGLVPTEGRGSPIAGIVLTNGDLDHCLGLLLLREWTPLVVYATPIVWQGLVEQNALFRTLQRYPGQLTWRELTPDRELELLDRTGRGSGLFVTPRVLAGKPPVHLEGLAPDDPAQNVGLWLRNRAGRRAVYAPGVGALGGLGAALEGSDAVLVDGTFWEDDELRRHEQEGKSAKAIAHWPLSGPLGTLQQLRGLRVEHRWLTHINNTNPILRPESPERRAVEDAGFRVASDGWELEL